MPRRQHLTRRTAPLLAALLLAGSASTAVDAPSSQDPEHDAPRLAQPAASDPRGTLTLAFAGDVHFEDQLADLLDDPAATLGPMSRHLRAADLSMVNLESALIRAGRRTGKALEEPAQRFWFRSPPAALDLLDRSGVDVVSMANNHGADFGARGLRQTLATAAGAPVAVVGVGKNAAEAFAPYRVRLHRQDVAVLAADASFRESRDPIWAAGEGGPGIASARDDPPWQLGVAVRQAALTADLVVVYLHWGRARQECPTVSQRRLAHRLASAGADVIVGTHGHVLQGAGMLADTYVAYGLGNFLWYHGREPKTGVLEVTAVDGRVVASGFAPARIPRAGGQPQPLGGTAASRAREEWRRLRGCTGLAAAPRGPIRDPLPAFTSRIREIGPALRRRLSGSHDGPACPVGLADLRHLTLRHVGFDGRAHTGELVVHADYAEDVVSAFQRIYEARWPIRRMRLVDEYGGDDDRSMAADNTSAYNCRRVAGGLTWSAHAYGAAVDINPVENPYVLDGEVRPPAGRRYAAVDRSAGAAVPPGVIQEGGVVTRAFARIGWRWGATFSDPDYQHFTAR